MNDETYRFDQNDIQTNKGLSCLSYLSLLVLIPLLVNQPPSPFTKFHINQGIVLLIVSVIGGVIGSIFGWIPFIGAIISSVIGIFVFVLLIIGFVNTVSGKAVRLPIIGNIEIYR